jgi:DNA-directed RNA polymerase subunit A"
MTRLLTEEEIEFIIDFVVIHPGIPIETSLSIVRNTKNTLRNQLSTCEIIPDIIPQLKAQIEKDYRQTLLQPGESVGILAAQSIGERNTQLTLNSVDWNEKLLYINNGNIIIEPIGKFIDRSLKYNSENITLIKENRTQYLSLPDKFFVPSCDENGLCDWYKIEAVTKHLPVGKLVKVVTQSGRNVTATQAKSFLVWNGVKFINTLGSNIKIGDILPTTHTLPKPNQIYKFFDMESIFPKNKYLYTSEIVKVRKLKYFKRKSWSEHNGKEFTLPYNYPDTCFTKIKNYFMTCKPGFIHTSDNFTSGISDKIPLDNNFGFFIGLYLANGWCTKTSIGISNKNEVIKRRITDFCDIYGVTYHIIIKNFRTGLGDLKLRSTLLTRMFMNVCNTGSKKRVPEFAYTAPDDFIKGLFDGYFSGSGTIGTNSVLASSISENLLLGISFLLSYFKIFGNLLKNSIIIENEFVQQFTKEISITDPEKQKKLDTIVCKYEKIQSEFPSRDVYFDMVVSVEYINGSTDYVYDLTVADTRNFQLWNGLNIVDTFHRAGQSEKAMTAGVPRFQELLNATKSPKLVNCKVFFNKGNETIQSLRRTIGHSIVGLTFKDISKSITVKMMKEDEPWYESFKIIYNSDFTKYTDCISIKINMEILFEYKLTIQEIVDVISREYDDLSCVFSPPSIGQLDIFVDTSNIELPEERLSFIDTENAPEIYLEECVQPILEKMIICGISGITNIYYIQEGEEWIIETDGTNFKQLLSHPDVDMTRVVSNNVWEIYETLGIEAVREFLIEEYMSIMDGINICHTKLLVERMTYSGTISSISRYTMRKEEAGPMGKASFEETMDNFLKAAANGDIEPTNGVSASIICGKRPSIGTGMMDLKIDVMKLPHAVPILADVVEETQEAVEERKVYESSYVEF